MREKKYIDRLIGIDTSLYHIYENIQKEEEQGTCTEMYLQRQMDYISLCINVEEQILDEMHIDEVNIYTYVRLLGTENSISMYTICNDIEKHLQEPTCMQFQKQCLKHSYRYSSSYEEAEQFDQKLMMLEGQEFLQEYHFYGEMDTEPCKYPTMEFISYAALQVLQDKQNKEGKWDSTLESLLENTITHPILLRICTNLYRRLYMKNIITDYNCDNSLLQFINTYTDEPNSFEKVSDISFVLKAQFGILALKRMEMGSRLEQKDLFHINQMLTRETDLQKKQDLIKIKYTMIFSSPILENELLKQKNILHCSEPISVKSDVMAGIEGRLGRSFISYYSKIEILKFLHKILFYNKEKVYTENIPFLLSMFSIQFRDRVAFVQNIDYIEIGSFVEVYFEGWCKEGVKKILAFHRPYNKDFASYQKQFTKDI